jgi:hypothetical protein
MRFKEDELNKLINKIVVVCNEKQKQILKQCLNDLKPCLFNYELCDNFSELDEDYQCVKCMEYNVLFILK